MKRSSVENADFSIPYANENLHKVRVALKLTQEDFSNKLLIKRSKLAAYEEGRATPADMALKSVFENFRLPKDRYYDFVFNSLDFGISESGAIEIISKQKLQHE